MFERLLIGSQRCAAFFDPLADNHAICFKIADALLIGTDDGFAVSFHKPIHKLSDLALDLRKLGLHRLALFFHRLGTLIPQVTEQRRSPLEKLC
ncbi:hypothetical protein [Pyruvatibacter mobilis]|uniref:hypothetical protein n=1 Tax=Pyruvatibacter mobilis TaxID=1712261 RepID=UPI003BAAA008